ncbi:ABC transporter permease [Desulfoferrobacter suflitae]|uniref:ABC transporter permease n=1 Tax=Desulfoferrobacter suflitae TaxID=2865782 RepID=UPI00216434C3|nr:ABC transporter permease [Desulfoferrobacter suflitae]MCK8604326.1 ABC transporter permease [Desulfoferrobacter suflitae]
MSNAFGKAYRFSIVVLLIAAGIALERFGVITYLSDPYELNYLLTLLTQHVWMVFVSMSLATILGLAVGIIFTRPRYKKYAGIVMYIVGLGQTIPSLAVIALAMSFLGIGFKPAIFALFVYSVLPVARNTLAGITAVPGWIIDAAKGMGMPNGRILFQIELPNAMKVIITGFRISLVINIGTAALAFLIGAGGLGELIFVGIDLMRPDQLLAGAIPVTLLALFADYLVELLGLVVIPRGLRIQEELGK